MAIKINGVTVIDDSQNGNLTGLLQVAGNISGGNVSGTNVTGTLTTAAQPNITSVGTLTSLAVTGNVTSGNVSGTTVAGTTGTFTNISGTLTTAAQTNITSVGTLTSLTVNGLSTHTGNIDVTGNINVTGNLNYANVTDLSVGDPLIYIGANNTGNLYDLGMVVAWNDGTYQHGGWVRDASDGTWKLFGNVAEEPTTVINFTNATYQPMRAGAITATTGTFSGNVSTGNISGTSVTGTLTTAAQPNITSVGALNSGSITSGFGAIDIGTDTVTCGGIINANGNGVGNIGSSTTYFNTVFAKATSAQYADLAEMYEADGHIEPGTVVCFGGSKEVTICQEDGCRRIAGVISTNPSYLMNSGQTGDHVVAVALQGRVPVRVTGRVRKGDMMVATGDGRARAEADPKVGSVIGKALADFDGSDGVIEVVIGRL